MASSRYKTIPIQHKNGRVVRTRVKRENLGAYGKMIVNARGKIAYARKEAEVRVFEALRGAETPLLRIRFHAKTKGTGTDPNKGRNRFYGEAEVRVVLPDGTDGAFEGVWQETIHNLMQSAGLPGEGNLVFGRESAIPAAGLSIGVEQCSVYFRDRLHEGATAQLRQQLEPWFTQFHGLEGKPAPELIAGMKRAKLDAKSGRYRDAKTGRFTLNPELLP